MLLVYISLEGEPNLDDGRLSITDHLFQLLQARLVGLLLGEIFLRSVHRQDLDTESVVLQLQSLDVTLKSLRVGGRDRMAVGCLSLGRFGEALHLISNYNNT